MTDYAALVSPRHNFYTAMVIESKLAEIDRKPRAECPSCGRDCGVYWPRGGDGTVRITVWHKKPGTTTWCRAEVDMEEIRFTR